MKFAVKYLLPVLLLLAIPLTGHAQFREEAFQQTYNDDADTLGRDTTDVLFSFKEFFGGINHTQNARIGTMFAGSMVFIGAQQMNNRQYWKLPIIYTGLAATAGMGIWMNNRYRQEGGEEFKQMSTWFFAGTGLIYWGALMDGVINYKRDIPHQPGKATLYSLLLPGLGQAYNGEYWKIPIYYGFMVGAAHFLAVNSRNYERYRSIYNAASAEDSTYDGNISAATALEYRNIFRRYRDYSVVALLGFYLLQVIDANVFSYMGDFEINDDISLHVSPSVMTDRPAFGGGSYAFNYSGLQYSPAAMPGVGLRLGLTF